MLDLKIYVSILLVIAAIGMGYIFRVIREQLKLFKKPIKDRDIRHFRNVLFIISIVIVVMGSIPIGINLLTLFVDTGRPPQVGKASILYSLGVHLQSLLLSYLLWQIYKLAGKKIDE